MPVYFHIKKEANGKASHLITLFVFHISFISRPILFHESCAGNKAVGEASEPGLKDYAVQYRSTGRCCNVSEEAEGRPAGLVRQAPTARARSAPSGLVP